MSAHQQQYGDDVPFETLQNFPQTPDLSGQIDDDSIPASTVPVHLTIKQVKPDVYEKDGVPAVAKLRIRLAIGPDGIDGDGRYAKRQFWIPFITYVDPEVYPKWVNFGIEYSSLLKALGYDAAKPPQVNDGFLGDLVDREFTATIRRVKRQVKVDGVYRDTEEFENKLARIKAA